MHKKEGWVGNISFTYVCVGLGGVANQFDPDFLMISLFRKLLVSFVHGFLFLCMAGIYCSEVKCYP